MNFLEKNGLQTAQTHFKDIFQNNIHRNYADAMLTGCCMKRTFSPPQPLPSTTAQAPAACWYIA